MQTFQGTIYPWHCDHMGHMNVQFYTAKFDEATWNFLSGFGITPQYMKENSCGMVALEQHTKFRKEVLAGDNIYIESAMIEVKDKVVIFRHNMKNFETRQICAETILTGLHIDTKLRKALSFPEAISASLLSALPEKMA